MRIATGLPATLSVLLLLGSGSALADRSPDTQEREQIEMRLTELGYTSWEEIAFDDGHWEIDDAVAEDGATYDLKLDPDTLEVVERDHE